MDKETIRGVGRTYTRGTTQVGPRHDPYHREYTHCKEGDRFMWVLTCCSLAGTFLLVHGSAEAIKDEAEIEAIIGGSIETMTRRIFDRATRARMRRMTPEAREEYYAIREAEAQMLRYAM